MLIDMKRRSGFVTFDNLTAMLVVLIIFTSAITASDAKLKNYELGMKRQILHNKLVSAGEYAVKYEALKEDNVIYPNWLGESYEIDSEFIKNTVGLSAVRISFSPKEDMECIYRLVLVGPEKEIRKIYVCGEG